MNRQGWSERAAAQLKFSWAKSTIKQYDRYIKAFESFCDENGHDFPRMQTVLLFLLIFFM